MLDQRIASNARLYNGDGDNKSHDSCSGDLGLAWHLPSCVTSGNKCSIGTERFMSKPMDMPAMIEK